MYNFEKAEVFGVSDTASTIIKSQEGIATTSSITPSITRDSRDSYLDRHPVQKLCLFHLCRAWRR